MDTPEELASITSWFSECPVYQGEGRAEFADPHGFVEGPATASFDRDGSAHVSLEVEHYEADEPLRFGLSQLLSRRRPQKVGAGFGLGFGGVTNPCTRFTIKTPNGVFSMTEKIILGATLRLFGDGGTLQLQSIWSTYEANDVGPVRYWVLPIFNFVEGLASTTSDLDSHPLRLSPPVEVASNVVNERAEHTGALANGLLAFEFDGELAFVEQLLDFTSRKDRLSNREAGSLITVVAVGSQKDQPPSWPELVSSWRPLHLAELLGLAGGVRVWPAWIEFRDPAGRLVRRFHADFTSSPFHQGFKIIDEAAVRATGQLLTKAMASPDFGSSWSTVTLDHLIEFGRLDKTVEERMWHLVQVFEALLSKEGLQHQQLLDGIDQQTRRAVKAALATAADTVAGLAKTDTAHAAQLKRIADRARSADQADKMFGLAVRDLLNRYALPDVEIVNQFYRSNPRGNGRTFEQVIGHYRGEVVHKVYFDFLSGAFDPNDVYLVERHLHDLAIRMVFKLLGYDGYYRSPIEPGDPTRSVAWVTPNTSAEQLGYGRYFLTQ